MERIPVGFLWVVAAVLVALGIWSFTDENWSGVIVSAVLAVVCVVLAMRRSRPTP